MGTVQTIAVPEYENELRVVDSLPTLKVIKYRGSKRRLLPIITRLTRHTMGKGGTFLDLMAGTHRVGYALKQQYRIYANDVQGYSFTIGRAFVENGGYSISRKLAQKELMKSIHLNQRTKAFNLFQETYSDTYFTATQCREIDNIRAAVEDVPTPRREAYLALLMSAMCSTSNTTGHFAEYLSKPLSNPKSVIEVFFHKCENLTVAPNRYANKVFNVDYRKFLLGVDNELTEIMETSNMVYIDPPYSSAQYSRFYHLLETLVKYDYPKVQFKGRYRKDRFFSDFCRKSKAKSELDYTLQKCSELNRGFVLLSYVDSKSCLIQKNDFQNIVSNHFAYVTKPLTCPISHSKQGNGASGKVIEYLILATNSSQGIVAIDKINHNLP